MNDARPSIASTHWLEPQPAAIAIALPSDCYVDVAFGAHERDSVFARSWQLVAHASQVENAGDHVVAEIAGVPLVIVRGTDGTLRALHNVCRHRAGPLALCSGRGARALICKYHGWSYELDGRLRGAPEMRDAPGFEIDSIRLPQAQVTEWQGLVFAALDDPPPFESIVTGIDARFADFVHSNHISYEIACNWKVYVDNFLEGYHLPIVHPALNRVLDFRQYRTELARWHSLQWSPLDQAQGPYSAGEALYYWLYPNTMLNILPGRLQTNRVVPLAPQRCRVEFDYFYAADATPTAADSDREFADQVQAEDIAICEAVQRGLASGSYIAGRLNPTRESGVWHFHELLRAAFRAAPPSP